MRKELEGLVYRAGERTTSIQERGGVTYLTYNLLNREGLRHGISTRLGGVSEGYLGEMNLSFSRGDDPERVEENHRRFAGAVGYPRERLVLSDQIHETVIRRVEERDAGSVPEKGVDGLMTDVPGLPLMTFYADCVPLLFYDHKKRVIGMAHSGWRGTAGRIGRVMLERLGEEYGTCPEDVLVAIGPSICQNCYEVDREVYENFTDEFGEAAEQWFCPSGREAHFLLDLAGACRHTLREAGVPDGQIALPDLCTSCNPQFLFSHRASGGKRGNLGAVMMLEEA